MGDLLGRSRLYGGIRGCRRLLRPRTCEDILQTVVTLMTGVLVYSPAGLAEFIFAAPSLRPDCRVFHLELIQHAVCAGAGKAFRDFEILPRSKKSLRGGEI